MRAEILSATFNLYDSGIFPHDFCSRINLKLHNVSVILEMFRKNMTALNSPKTFYHYCIPVVAQYNCFSDLSLILADLFNISLKKSHFSYCLRVLFVVFVLKNNRERSMIRHNHFVSLPFVISKIFEELLKSRITDLLGKCFL